jgi:hypothetical protein
VTDRRHRDLALLYALGGAAGSAFSGGSVGPLHPPCRAGDIRISSEPMTKKILVSVDEALLARIDRAARRSGLSRSAYLARLAERELGAAGGPGRDPRARRAMRALEDLFQRRGVTEEATAAIRAERDAR